MAVHIRLAEKIDLPEIIRTMEKAGLPCKEAIVRRYFFENPLLDGFEESCSGFVVVDDAVGIVGFQGMTPCLLYYKQRPLIGFQLGVLGVLPNYRSYMFDMIDAVIEKAAMALLFANTANQKSSMLWTGYGGCVPGHPNQAMIRFAVPSISSLIKYTVARRLNGQVPWPLQLLAACFRPLDACRKLNGLCLRKQWKYETQQLTGFDDECFNEFWKNMLDKNGGLIVSRDPDRLRRLFSHALNEGTATLLVAKAGKDIQGYILLKRDSRAKLDYPRHMIVDWCAIGNDRDVLECLIDCASVFSRKRRAAVLEFVGGIQQTDDLLKRYLPYQRKALANTFFYRTDDQDIMHAVESSESWFGGPYDGDRCAM